MFYLSIIKDKKFKVFIYIYLKFIVNLNLKCFVLYAQARPCWTAASAAAYCRSPFNSCGLQKFKKTKISKVDL
jgi:hypothetical protein